MSQKIRNLDVKNVSKKEKKMNPNVKRCPLCKSVMRARGAGNANGSIYWKCRNKSCGETVWKHIMPVPPVPIVFKSLYK